MSNINHYNSTHVSSQTNLGLGQATGEPSESSSPPNPTPAEHLSETLKNPGAADFASKLKDQPATVLTAKAVVEFPVGELAALSNAPPAPSPSPSPSPQVTSQTLFPDGTLTSAFNLAPWSVHPASGSPAEARTPSNNTAASPPVGEDVRGTPHPPVANAHNASGFDSNNAGLHRHPGERSQPIREATRQDRSTEDVVDSASQWALSEMTSGNYVDYYPASFSSELEETLGQPMELPRIIVASSWARAAEQAIASSVQDGWETICEEDAPQQIVAWANETYEAALSILSVIASTYIAHPPPERVALYRAAMEKFKSVLEQNGGHTLEFDDFPDLVRGVAENLGMAQPDGVPSPTASPSPLPLSPRSDPDPAPPFPSVSEYDVPVPPSDEDEDPLNVERYGDKFDIEMLSSDDEPPQSSNGDRNGDPGELR